MIAKVLLIDDEAPFVETMRKRLSKRDLSICTAFSGSEGLERLRQEGDIDVVILDVMMPGLDGIDTLREIKKRFPLVEVILLTGHGSEEAAIEGMKLGAFDFLLKPCSLEQLLGKVQGAKSKKSRHEARIIRVVEEIAGPPGSRK